MNTIKLTYQPPQIAEVRLDNEISLVLNSLPPFGPDEQVMNKQAPEYFNNTTTLQT